MVPPQPTRRDALHLSGLALLGLAGCATQGSSDSTPDGTPTPTATEREYPNSVDDPPTRKVRNHDGEPAIRSSAHTPSRDGTSQGQMESDSNWHHEYWFVTEPADRDDLEFTHSSSGVDAANAFVADTDLSAATLLVQQDVVEECTTVELQRLEWTKAESGPGDRISVQAIYEDRSEDDCATDSPHDSAHESDDSRGTTVRAIVARIPVDASRIDRFQYGW